MSKKIIEILINSRYRAYWKYYRFVSKVLKYNRDFLFQHEPSLLDEIVEFQLDVIDYYRDMIEKFKYSPFKGEFFNRFCLPNYIANILFPVSYSLYPALLTAYLPHCYNSLRLCIEALGIMYLAEDFPCSWFGRKLEKFKRSASDKSTSEILLKVSPQLRDLFRRFSDWLHTTGYTRRVTEYFFKHHVLPARSWGAPMPYDENDLDELRRLEHDINDVREFIPQILRKWYQKIGI